ncbi:MAG: hypothetical protein M1812_006487 [Candelaria pacifica]|nr:MAG: hypothetical protein M1812_006487 [Candelaria pacifica]
MTPLLFLSCLVAAASAISPRVPAALSGGTPTYKGLDARDLSHLNTRNMYDLEAAPLPGLRKLLERDSACPNPQSDTERVDNYNCPKKLKMDAKGNCPVAPNAGANGQKINTCTTYCEVKVSWFYGHEVPYSGTRCAANSPCTFATARSVAVTNTYEFNIGGANVPKVKREADADAAPGFTKWNKRDDGSIIKGAFNFGASFSYSTTVTTTQTLTQPRPTDGPHADKCGYWSFIPYYIASCGSVTSRKIRASDTTANSAQCSGNYVTTGNVCNNTPYTVNGAASGTNIFVYVDCNTNAKLDASLQDPIFNQPGVAGGGVPAQS